MSQKDLKASLAYEPRPLRFGTSGRRGDVTDLTQLEIYLTALAELEYLQSLSPHEGGIRRGEPFYYAYDLRPSSTRFVPEQGGRGELAQAVDRAIRDAGMQPVNLGRIPTPALTAYALARGKGSIMITGSHIPFERNGYKTNTARGELLKKDEEPINRRVEAVRERLYRQPFAQSLFNEQGLFKTGHAELPPANPAGRDAYIRRYLDFFGARSLAGQKLLVYQHSAVGRDLLVQILEQLGAETIAAGRSETFVPIDTENIDEAVLATVQALADAAVARHGPIDAVVSIDGDSDRPLILGVEPAGRRVTFFGGDLVGMVVAEFLGADAVVVPISCNDAIDRGPLKEVLEPKTRIGSPFVVAGMESARAKGRKAVCGWEANGGFLLGSDLERNGRVLPALPTRDALLPILSVLSAAAQARAPLSALFARLPRRFSQAALLRQFPRSVSLQILRQFSPEDPRLIEVRFENGAVALFDSGQNPLPTDPRLAERFRDIRARLGALFAPVLGFGSIARLNYTDGLRIYFGNGDVAHVRPSGNADELRIYAVADTQERANAITRLGVAEPDGLLRRLARAVTNQKLSS
jgi:phosphomannomutase